MQNLFGIKPELQKSIRTCFPMFSIVHCGGRPVKSKSGRLSKEIQHEGKDIIVATVREFNIMWN